MNPPEPPFEVGDVIDVAIPPNTVTYGDIYLGVWPGGSLFVWCRGVRRETIVKIRTSGIAHEFKEILGVAEGTRAGSCVIFYPYRPSIF